MYMNDQALEILKKQEHDREQGKKVAGAIGLIVIVPIMLVVIFAIIVIASA